MQKSTNKKRKNPRKNPTSSDLLNDKFSYLVGNVLESVRKDTVPFVYDKKEIFLGDHTIRKEDKSYVIYHKKDVIGPEPCYFLLESALLVSFSLQHKRKGLLNTISQLDHDFSKYYFDCINIYRVIKELRTEGDNSRANALIDKYNYAKEKRDYVKKTIRSLCKRNIKKR